MCYLLFVPTLVQVWLPKNIWLITNIIPIMLFSYLYQSQNINGNNVIFGGNKPVIGFGYIQQITISFNLLFRFYDTKHCFIVIE